MRAVGGAPCRGGGLQPGAPPPAQPRGRGACAAAGALAAAARRGRRLRREARRRGGAGCAWGGARARGGRWEGVGGVRRGARGSWVCRRERCADCRGLGRARCCGGWGGRAWEGRTQCCGARRGGAWRGGARRGGAWRGGARRGGARCGGARLGGARPRGARRGGARPCIAQRGGARCGERQRWQPQQCCTSLADVSGWSEASQRGRRARVARAALKRARATHSKEGRLSLPARGAHVTQPCLPRQCLREEGGVGSGHGSASAVRVIAQPSSTSPASGQRSLL